MILRTISCERKICDRSYTEKVESEGFPSWGHVAGLANEKGEAQILHVCPQCMQQLIHWFKGANINGLD